jgi:hypothetical protein
MEEHGIKLKDPAKACVVVSAGTYRRRTGSIGTFKLGLIDEEHHLGESQWGEIMNAHPEAYWAGFTPGRPGWANS